MPLVRISLRKGKTPDYRRAIAKHVYEALREAFKVPDEDRFVLIDEYEGSDFIYSPSYLGVTRDDDLVMIQITANNTRTVDQKKALYAAIAERLAKDPGIRPENVLISLVEVAKENWSFGNGVAQYA
ncbi:MAG: tautomerase family protein [Beijerinckiaceae bacterium]|nr:MAG: tautomerase family protein [Beijerinckiaceae bacterium]